MSFSLFGINSFQKTGLELKKPVQFEHYDIVNTVVSNSVTVKLTLISAISTNIKVSGKQKVLIDGKMDYGVMAMKSNNYTKNQITKLRPRNKCDYVRCSIGLI